jgi:hypothetical protein
MKRLIPLLLPLALSACLKVEPATAVVAVDRVYSVDEFLAQPELRKKVSAVCSNDPGRLGQDPNCINVVQADHIASAGSLGNMPRAVP